MKGTIVNKTEILPVLREYIIENFQHINFIINRKNKLIGYNTPHKRMKAVSSKCHLILKILLV